MNFGKSKEEMEKYQKEINEAEAEYQSDVVPSTLYEHLKAHFEAIKSSDGPSDDDLV